MPIRRVLAWLLAACVLLLVAAPAALALERATVAARLAQGTTQLGSASSVRAIDADTGEVLFSRRPDLRLVPASTQKLFTTATALLRLGPQARLETRVVADAAADPLTGEVETTALYLVGGGDPSFSNTDLTGLADQIAATGLSDVDGGVVGDEGLLDARRGSVDSGFAPDFDLGGQLGALVVGRGVSDRRGPAHVAATRLQALLKSRGVRFGRAAGTGPAPAGATVLAADRSPSMGELARATNQPSDNFYAELLLKVVGAKAGEAGSTAGGAAVVRTSMAGLGLRPTISDGSGLTRRNRTTSRQVVTLLRAMRDGPASAAWLGSMTVAGRNGTLRRRMRATAAAGRCSGKTGTLRGVSALSGYCTTTGRTVAFSIIANGVGYGAKAIEDRMVTALAGYEG